MEHKPKNSSTIEAIGYDPAAKQMTVTFKPSGKVGIGHPSTTYAYDGVEQHVYNDFIAAESHGKHFAANIRKAYKGRML